MRNLSWLIGRASMVGNSSRSLIALESSFFSLGGAGCDDVVGRDISRIVMVVDSMSFDSPGRDPRQDGNWTDVRFALRLLIYGR